MYEIRKGKLGGIVKSNLVNCDKILVGQPTVIFDIAKEYNTTAEYLPVPYDPSIFFPKPLPESEEKSIFIASVHNFAVKGTDKFLRALANVKYPVKIRALRMGADLARFEKLARELNLNVELIDKVRHSEMSLEYWKSDLVLGSYSIKQLDAVAIEAMACGRPVIHSTSNRFAGCPLEDLGSIDEVSDLISALIGDRGKAEERVSDQLQYVQLVHSAPVVAKRLLGIYEALVEGKK